VNIYLDIDGVLITKGGEPKENVASFLEFIISHHNVYWLTTHCRGGESNAIEYLKDKLPEECIEYLYKIRPTDWKTLKTEGIDFTQDFLWYDDYVMDAEKKVLNEYNKFDCLRLIGVNDKLQQSY